MGLCVGQPQTQFYISFQQWGIQGPQMKNSNFRESPLAHLTKGSINAPAFGWLDTGDSGRSLGWEDPLGEKMATHSSIFAWKIPWTEEPGGLQSMRSQSQTRLSTAQ